MLIGYAMCASFCTIKESLKQMERLVFEGHEVLPILSERLYSTDTRFGAAADLIHEVQRITGHSKIVHSVVDAEPLGPVTPLDALIGAPCTGNTLAKVSSGITDTAVCMAIKAHLRTDRPLVIAPATNDAMSQNLQNIARLLTRRGVYFVPMYQDDPDRKPHSLVADFSRIPEVLQAALTERTMRPLFFYKERT